MTDATLDAISIPLSTEVGAALFGAGLQVALIQPASENVVVVATRSELPWPASDEAIQAALLEKYTAAVGAQVAQRKVPVSWGVTDGGGDWTRYQYWMELRDAV